MDHIKTTKTRTFNCEPSEPSDARFFGVSGRPLYPVAVFKDTKVDRIAEVARFGGYIFVKTNRGWSLDIMHNCD